MNFLVSIDIKQNLMLSIFGDTIHKDDRPYDEKWFSLYDDELERLD